MSDFSTNFQLPYVMPSQAQKAVTVNETIRALDGLLHLSVESRSTLAQPGALNDGETYILPPGKTGDDWDAYGNGSVAYYRDGAWEQLTPREGWRAWVRDEGVLLVHDGSDWVRLASNTNREVLSENRNYYVDGTDGSDSNDGLSAGSGGAFATIQKALDVIGQTLDTANFTVIINVADGTYDEAPELPFVLGGGEVWIVGNETTPANVHVEYTGGNKRMFQLLTASTYRLRGMKISATTATFVSAMYAEAGVIYFRNIDFGDFVSNNNTEHIYVRYYGRVRANGDYTISSDVGRHIRAQNHSEIEIAGRTITLTGTPDFNARFCQADGHAYVQINGNTFSGAATGERYRVTDKAMIDTVGGGAAYLPGDSAGSDDAEADGYV